MMGKARRKVRPMTANNGSIKPMLFPAARRPDAGKLQSRAERHRNQGPGRQGARLELALEEGWQDSALGR